MSWLSGSVGLFASHCWRLFAQSIPDAVITLVAVVARIVFSADCMPKAA